MPHLARARSIIDNKGIGSEASYPYTATDGTCKTVPSVATITGYTDVPANSQTALETAIVQQPISVAVEADQASFQLYSGGVMTAACGTALDHGVLAVGYGTLTGADYYKVKVSGRGGGRRRARGEDGRGSARAVVVGAVRLIGWTSRLFARRCPPPRRTPGARTGACRATSCWAAAPPSTRRGRYACGPGVGRRGQPRSLDRPATTARSAAIPCHHLQSTAVRHPVDVQLPDGVISRRAIPRDAIPNMWQRARVP
jgi:hypothetical protein